MSLFGIGKKLYKKDVPEDISKHDLSEYDPEDSELGEGTGIEKDEWVKEKKFDVATWRKIEKGLIAFGAIFVIAFSVVFIYEIRKLIFARSSVQVSISGPASIDSGHLVTYEINYKNNNWVNLKDAKLKITYPEDFQPEPNENFQEDGLTSGTYSLEKIGLRSSGKVVLSGRGYNPKGTLMYLEADLSYKASGYYGENRAADRLGVNIMPAPIKLEITGPQKIAAGNEVEYLVVYQNTGQETMDNLQLRMQYPENFGFDSAEPIPAQENNVWQIGSLAAGQSGKVLMRGRMSGPEGTTKIAEVSVGTQFEGRKFKSYNDETLETQISKSPFLISQTVNGLNSLNINAGENLEFVITYKNNSNIGFRDVVLTEKLDNPILDYASLNLTKGSFDIVNKQIIWKASDIPSLKALGPGAGGEIVFSIHVKDNIPLDGDMKKNFVVKSLAKIDSPDVQTTLEGNKIVSSNEMSMKLNSKMILETQGFYNDSAISNSGPIPPQVSQTTTYTIHWTVRNVSNDINNAQVTAVLPTNATATGKFSPDSARISYNERTNSITWDIGKMDAGSGILNAPLKAAFQVKITPSTEQRNHEVGLLGISTFSAKDLFTGDDLKVSTAAKDTNLVEDKALTMIDGARVK